MNLTLSDPDALIKALIDNDKTLKTLKNYLTDYRANKHRALMKGIFDSVNDMKALGVDMQMQHDPERPQNRLPPGFIERVIKEKEQTKEQADKIASDENAQALMIQFFGDVKNLNMEISDNRVQYQKAYKETVSKSKRLINSEDIRAYVIGILSAVSINIFSVIYPTPAGENSTPVFTHIVSDRIEKANARIEKDNFKSKIIDVLEAGELVTVIGESELSYKILCLNSDLGFCYVAKKSQTGIQILDELSTIEE